ncbi:MAG: aminotransferase class IV [Rhodoferax sp.]|nr:aminotransferase class IV [Rhodoferax sp.]MBP7574214.1 aminotransferase class IV [Rhodoferax sp.]MBP8135770.1 aminotransferase class IV [Rhodoferax sp.]
MQGCAYVNGQFVPPSEAKISIFDWGFLHSDATYDVAHVWQGNFFRLGDHLDRFFNSMQTLRLNCGKTRDEVHDIMHECVRRSGLRDAYVEVLCTRGMPAPGSRDPRSATNQFMAFAIPFVWIANPEKQKAGINLIVTSYQRIPPSSVDPTVKNYHWLDMVMALFQAYERGGETALLVDAAGNVAEGPGFNVFAVHNGEGGRKVVTTPNRGVLEGVSRRTMIDLCTRLGHDMRVEPLTVERLRQADEVFLSSTGGGAIAVSHLDGQPIAGRPAGEFGPVTCQLQAAYWALHNDPAYSEPVIFR